MTERLTWTGWIRVAGGDWTRACVAPTWRLCWDELLSCMAAVPAPDAPVCCSLSVEALVNDGRHPDHRRRPR